MNYELHYKQLIDRAYSRTLTGYVEKHHILPKSMGGLDNKENIVELTPREHFIAHLLLVKIHPLSLSMVKAVAMMCCSGIGQDRSMNRMYGWLKEKHSLLHSKRMLGSGNTQFGSIWIHNTYLKKSTKIKKDDDIPHGWVKGRVINFDKISEIPKCNKCGDTVCMRPNICKKHQMINTLVKFFGFNEGSKGSVKFYEEFDRIKNKLETEYNGGLSTIDLVSKYNLTSTQRLDSIFKSLGIKPKTLSEALKNYTKKNIGN